MNYLTQLIYFGISISMFVSFFEAIFAKITSVFATAIIAVGLVSVPVSQLEPVFVEIVEEKEVKDSQNVAKEVKQSDVTKPAETEKKKETTKEELGEESKEKIEIGQQEVISDLSKEFRFNPDWRDSLVNLFCTFHNSPIIGGVSGSGVVVDPRGVILTNAHVGMHFLFDDRTNEDRFMDCTVRIGSPAVPMYYASLLYFPEQYMRSYVDEELDYLTRSDKGASIIVNGEKDYALLIIRERTEKNKSLPETFSYLPVAKEYFLPVGAFTYISGYQSALVGYESVLTNLYVSSSPARVYSLNSIGDSIKNDVMKFLGTIAGQSGVSGGAIVKEGGYLAGVPTFKDEGDFETTDSTVLNAISTGYISRDLKKETGKTLEEFITQDNLTSISDKFLGENRQKLIDIYAEYYNKLGVIVHGINY